MIRIGGLGCKVHHFEQPIDTVTCILPPDTTEGLLECSSRASRSVARRYVTDRARLSGGLKHV